MDRIDLVGVGSLYAIERDGTIAAGGIAAEAPLAARALGVSTVPVARVGMDRLGTAITDSLKASGLDVSSIQVDSDLATARRVQRAAGVRIEPYAAFDNLQFDSDVEALARNAEVIVTDACSRRHSQARQAIDRMWTIGANAVRVVDLVRRSPSTSGDDRLDREAVGNAIELCQVFLVDRVALRTLVPATSDPVEAARRFATLVRSIAVLVLDDATPRFIGPRDTIEIPGWVAARSCEASVAAALAVVRGDDVASALASRS